MSSTFGPVAASLHLTLAGRALDSRAAQPFLNDTESARIADEIGYDVDEFPMARRSVFDIAVRAKRLDEVVSNFVGQHPEAVVLDLGAGLDPRASRVPVPAGVSWFDVDLPEVIEVRKRVLKQEGQIAADLTDPDWLDGIPGDRPVVAVADGLMAFLSDTDFAALLNRITTHFPSGEIAFNSYTRFKMWVVRHYKGTNSIATVVRHPGFDNPRDPERWAARLRLVEEIFLTRAPEVERLPLPQRLTNRIAARSATWSRQGTVVARYQF